MLENYEMLGEESIKDFFMVEGIQYKEEVELPNLKGDTKKYRRADFFLPKYNVHFEYMGRWNQKKAKKEYEEKMVLFEQNNIPCIYLYPDELANLRQVFYMKLQKNLIKRKMNLFAVKNMLKMNRFHYGFVLLSFALILFLAVRTENPTELLALVIALLATSLYLVLELYPVIKRYRIIKRSL